MAPIPLSVPSWASLFHWKGVPCLSVSGLCIAWPLLAVFHISAPMGPATHFCLISLTLLAKSLPPCLSLQLARFYTCLLGAVKRNDSRISHGLGSRPAWKTVWVDVSQNLSLTQVSPFHWNQQLSYICGVGHCKDFNLEPCFSPCISVLRLSQGADPSGLSLQKCRWVQSHS